MFSNDQKIDAANDLLREAKQYADLRLQRLKLDFVSKLTLLLSALVVSIVLLVVFAVVFLFVAYTLALAMAPHVGGLHWACAIIAHPSSSAEKRDFSFMLSLSCLLYIIMRIEALPRRESLPRDRARVYVVLIIRDANSWAPRS